MSIFVPFNNSLFNREFEKIYQQLDNGELDEY